MYLLDSGDNAGRDSNLPPHSNESPMSWYFPTATSYRQVLVLTLSSPPATEQFSFTSVL